MLGMLLRLQTTPKSLAAQTQHHLTGGAGFQILSVLTSKVWPNFTWQDAVCCLIQKIALLAEEAVSLGEALWWQWGEPGNRGWWVMDAESTASACCLRCAADGPRRCSARCPLFLVCCPRLQSCGNRRRTFGGFVLALLGAVGFFRQSLAICWIVFLAAWLVGVGHNSGT